MSQLSERKEVPQWLQRASRVLAEFMRRNHIRSFSMLHKETALNYRTLRKLAPGHIDPSVSIEAVANIFAQLGYYIKENDGTAIGENDDYECLDTELLNILMEYYGKRKTA